MDIAGVRSGVHFFKKNFENILLSYDNFVIYLNLKSLVGSGIDGLSFKDTFENGARAPRDELIHVSININRYRRGLETCLQA